LHVLNWAAWPRGARWLAGGIAAAVLVLALAWVLFVPAADWLAHQDVGSAKGPLLQTARDTARGRLLTLGAGLLAGAVLVLAARALVLLRRGQVTDRYTKAIEQLGSTELDVRIGGIYALEGVARDSARDHPMVMEVLTAFVREHSREQWPPPDSPRTTWTTWRGRFRTGGRQQERFTRPDVQAAVTVLGRRDARRDIQRIHLNGADLTGADLSEASLGGADLTEATLRDADLVRADLTGATLRDADLTRADLTEAALPSADLGGADLTEATLRGTGLRSADLQATTLTGATLTRADLTSAFLGGADLTEATLAGADLGSADLTRARLFRTDFTRATLGGTTLAEATLTGAKWPAGTPVPRGWKLDTRTGRLIAAAGTDPGSAGAT
jgi:uncharacterized protein YjbI with pentapeptide repeats